ncbi:galactose oxidase [Prochlorococcus sp. MIT 1341]|uniref:galactose oxidase n=1 Tax=Prochlorococcus sp. MIT 1341 TaxID=3096221 RepID=UPI002A755453|nr:galactose oxidase [Prochlorococcus sp. MIT 1341]
MSPYRTQKVLQKKSYPKEEVWEYLEEGSLKKSRSACVCMTCQHFGYSCDKHCRTLLTCRIRERLIPHGEHLNSRCPLWMRRTEEKISWCPEAT